MGEMADAMVDGWNGRAGAKRQVLKKVCYFCGESDLRWGNIDGGHWRLHTIEGERHVCAEFITRAR